MKKRPHIITLIRVSSQVLRDNSSFFNAHFKEFGFDEIMGIHHISLPAFTLWLRIVHGCVDEEGLLDLAMTDFERAIEIGNEYEFKLSKMSVWFSIWLGSQDLRNLDTDDLRRLLSISTELSHYKASEVLNILITEAESGDHDPAISNAFKYYPPVPVMSTRQNSILLFLLEVVPVQKYERWGFSESFKAAYGEPLEYYYDFYRLMTTVFDHKVVPRLKRFASLGADEISGRYLWFCEMCDDIAQVHSLPMLKRREMEAAWIWNAFDLYEKDSTIDPVALKKAVTHVSLMIHILSRTLLTHFSESIHGSRSRHIVSIRTFQIVSLTKFLYLQNSGTHKLPAHLLTHRYIGQDKCAKLGWAQDEIAFLNDGCEEDPETERIVDGDEDLEMDTVFAAVAGEQNSTQLEGLVEGLAIRPKIN